MDDFLVEADADVAWKFFIAEERAFDPGIGHELGGGVVDFGGGDAWAEHIGKGAENLRRGLACEPHFFDFVGPFDRDHAASFMSA